LDSIFLDIKPSFLGLLLLLAFSALLSDIKKKISHHQSRQIGQINSGAFGPGIFVPFWYSESLGYVFHYSTIISKKTKPSYPHPKCLFGIGS
jgi:hypothetical protein